MARDYVAPEFQLDAFTCPFCGAFAHFLWREVYWSASGGRRQALTTEAVCSRCNGVTVWLLGSKSILWPRDTGNAPLPNVDMPDDIKRDYLEARSICNASPRGAAALLRLSIQRLCKHLGETGKNTSTDISNLVKKGLPVQIQQALDIVRVTGNYAVHPGEMQLDDNQQAVSSLFQLVNLIVESQISQPKAVGEMYGKLPKEALGGIQSRDASAKKTGQEAS